MSDDVLERAETILRTPPHERYVLERTIRDLAAAVRDLRAWQAAAMANHKDFERSQRELHERAEKAETALTDAERSVEQLAADIAEGNGEVESLVRELDKARGLLEQWQADHPGVSLYDLLDKTRAFLAAHSAPACPGGKHCPHYPECGTRADPRPAPAGPCAACGKGHNSVDCPLVEMGMTWEGGDPPEPEP